MVFLLCNTLSARVWARVVVAPSTRPPPSFVRRRLTEDRSRDPVILLILMDFAYCSSSILLLFPFSCSVAYDAGCRSAGGYARLFTYSSLSLYNVHASTRRSSAARATCMPDDDDLLIRLRSHSADDDFGTLIFMWIIFILPTLCSFAYSHLGDARAPPRSPRVETALGMDANENLAQL